jgi:hypothetical protein
MDIRYRRPIILTGILVAVLAAWQIPSIQVDSNFQSFFREDDPIRQASDVINEHLAGSSAFYVTIDGEEKGIIKKWDTLRRIKDLQRYIDSLPGIEKTISLVDYCEILDRGIQAIPPLEGMAEASEPQGETTFWENPSQLDGVMQLVFLNASSISGVANHPVFSRTNIIVRTSLTRASDVTTTIEKIQAFAVEDLSPRTLGARYGRVDPSHPHERRHRQGADSEPGSCRRGHLHRDVDDVSLSSHRPDRNGPQYLPHPCVLWAHGRLRGRSQPYHEYHCCDRPGNRSGRHHPPDVTVEFPGQGHG